MATKDLAVLLSSSFGLDPAVEARLRAIGYRFDPETVLPTRQLFADRRDVSLPPGGERHDDVAYGTHARHRLDIRTPGRGGAQPVVVFVPGGGLTGGDKSFYAHIPAFFARQGFVGVGANYRLAPEGLFPAGAEDVAAAVDWLVGNVARYGGDPARIVIVAQSAGAIHAASAIFDRRARARHHRAIRAAVLMSGVYEITADHESGNLNVYFGNDPVELRTRSPLAHVADSDVPVIVTVAELEPAFFGLSAAALMHALTRRDGHPAQLVWLQGHNHLSPVLNMGSTGDELGPAIAAALRGYVG